MKPVTAVLTIFLLLATAALIVAGPVSISQIKPVVVQDSPFFPPDPSEPADAPCSTAPICF